MTFRILAFVATAAAVSAAKNCATTNGTWPPAAWPAVHTRNELMVCNRVFELTSQPWRTPRRAQVGRGPAAPDLRARIHPCFWATGWREEGGSVTTSSPRGRPHTHPPTHPSTPALTHPPPHPPTPAPPHSQYEPFLGPVWSTKPIYYSWPTLSYRADVLYVSGTASPLTTLFNMTSFWLGANLTIYTWADPRSWLNSSCVQLNLGITMMRP